VGLFGGKLFCFGARDTGFLGLAELVEGRREAAPGRGIEWVELGCVFVGLPGVVGAAGFEECIAQEDDGIRPPRVEAAAARKGRCGLRGTLQPKQADAEVEPRPGVVGTSSVARRVGERGGFPAELCERSRAALQRVGILGAKLEGAVVGVDSLVVPIELAQHVAEVSGSLGVVAVEEEGSLQGLGRFFVAVKSVEAEPAHAPGARIGGIELGGAGAA